MESLVPHKAALESRGDGELRRSLLEGKWSHELRLTHKTGCNQYHWLLLCHWVQSSRALPGHQQGRQRYLLQTEPAMGSQGAAPAGYCLTWALLTSISECR